MTEEEAKRQIAKQYPSEDQGLERLLAFCRLAETEHAERKVADEVLNADILTEG